MPLKDTESIPFFSSAAQNVMPSTRVSSDEENYDTLKSVLKILREATQALYKDFNAFHLPENVPKTTALYNIMVQIDGKQRAYEILSSCLESVESAYQKIDQKYKES